MPEKAQLADDIPLSRAWKAGRRVYVTCGYKSQLNGQLRDLGAKWDRDEEALWVGSGKLDQVLTLIREAGERAAEAEAVKGAGHWVKIPYDAVAVREQARQLGARWDKERKEWAMPTAEALAQVTALAAAYEGKAKADKAAAAEKEKAARAKAAEKARAEAARTDDDVIAASGRTVVSPERITLTIRMDYHGKKAGAEQYKEERGDVIRLRDGRRVLVLASAVEFWSEDMEEDMGQPGAGAGWKNYVTGVVVEPDAGEGQADADAEAARRDAEEIAALVRDAAQAIEPVAEQDARRVPAGQAAGRVTIRYGSLLSNDGGTLTLTTDGTAHWYHPGFYDDYRVTSGTSSDPWLVARVRAVLAAGSRERRRDSSAYSVEA